MAQATEVLGDTQVILTDQEGNLYEFSSSAMEQAKVSEDRKRDLHEATASAEVSGFGNWNPAPTTGTASYGAMWQPVPSRRR